MSEWRGLHNPERHEAFTVGGANPCVSCNLLCDSEWPCRCCLAAEVERLTERVRVLEVERDLAHEASYIKTKKLRDTAAVLAERDQRIARALAYCDDWKPISFAWSIQRILDGES